MNVICVTVLALASIPAQAATVEAIVRDAKGAPLENAVVWAVPKGEAAPRVRRDAAVEQLNKTFIPLVSVVQVGTSVRFPNRDEIRHHVYSFSPAKVFEIKLYGGTSAAPVLFDKPGEVVLGCNIHDHMVAYVYVVDSPWFAKAGKDGLARLERLPPGEYEVNAWHYTQAARPEAIAVKLDGEEARGSAAFGLATRVMPPRPAAR